MLIFAIQFFVSVKLYLEVVSLSLILIDQRDQIDDLETTLHIMMNDYELQN